MTLYCLCSDHANKQLPSLHCPWATSWTATGCLSVLFCGERYRWSVDQFNLTLVSSSNNYFSELCRGYVSHSELVIACSLLEVICVHGGHWGVFLPSFSWWLLTVEIRFGPHINFSCYWIDFRLFVHCTVFVFLLLVVLSSFMFICT